MIHYIDSVDEWNKVMSGDFIRYVHELHEKGSRLVLKWLEKGVSDKDVLCT